MAKRFEKARQFTEQYKGKLKPCPVCGNTDIQIGSDILDGKYMWSVNCMTMYCDYVWDTSIRRAVKKWNEKNRGGNHQCTET